MKIISRIIALTQTLLTVVFLTFAAGARADVTLIPAGSTWKFLDNGTNQGNTWSAPGFDDGVWASGLAELGYGDADEDTVVGYGPDAGAKYITTYFRKTFTVTDASALLSLKLSVLRDDGAVIYLNGVEIRRDNMPSGTVTYTTNASSALGVPQEATFYETTIATTGLVTGNNVLAVEIHQANGTSSDLSFDLQLIGVTTAAVPVVTRGPYLQSGTPTSVIVRWRTGTATDSRVSYGPTAATLNSNADVATLTTEHEVQLTGLTPGTQYFYSVGRTAGALASGVDYTFFTPPPVGTAQPTRIWVLGDSGTGTADQLAVRNAYTTFAGTRYTDLWLMLGDNVYETGTDAEYQSRLFNIYPTTLRQSVLWPTIGNHDTGGSSNPALTIPYFQAFSPPTAGEAGGAPSGTKKYYSFDYANIHFINLDSMTSDRSVNGPMLTWLVNDLESTNATWIVAFWHHPPYSMSYNSDTTVELKQMMENALPILEAGGVDLVLGGHAHVYERSWLIDGHYGLSGTFLPSMKLNGGDGREDGNGSYQKPGGLAAHEGAVYVVAGSSGKLATWVGGSTADTNPNPHPVMFMSVRRLGSLVIDVNGNRLDAKFLRETGAIDDHFTILKSDPNIAPEVSISAPLPGASLIAPGSFDVAASASDSDGSVTQVAFHAGAVLIGTDTTAPFSVTWNIATPGNYALTAVATDNLGATTTSAAVNVNVALPPPPASPTGLAATANDRQIELNWSASPNATSYNLKRGTVSGGPYTTISTGLDATNFTNIGLTNGTPYFYVVSAANLGGESANSNEVSATPLPPPPASPLGLTASAGDSQVGLTWTASATATSYNVKRATVSGGPFTAIATAITATAFTDATAANGTTYFYVVSAANLGGESANSNALSATPLPPPPASPLGLTASAGDSQVGLTWTASATATSYNVKRATVSGGPFTAIATAITATAFTDATAANGTTYFYVVSASNTGGESANSNETTATPAAPPLPAAPSSLTAAAASRTRINLAWADNATNETGFLIERSTNGTMFTQIATVGANVTTYANTGLKKNTTYWYRVRATNTAGSSAYSNTATRTTLP